jgi:hypothetical protein
VGTRERPRQFAVDRTEKSSQAGLVKNREMKRPWRDARAFHRLRLEDEDDEGDQAVMMIATIMIDSVNIFVCYGRP